MKKFIGYEKGVNLGGWFSQCEYTKENYDGFITENDFRELSTWGIDHVRIPIDYNLVETDNGEFIEDGMAYVQKAIDLCEKYGFNMILDLHKTAGFSFDEGEKESGLFESDILQERFYRLWEELARRFGRFHSRVAFEILNEVTDEKYCDVWNEIAETCIRKIRAIAPEVYILIGGYHNNCIEALADLRMPYDDKIVYNFHFYEPLVFTHQGAYWVKNMPGEFRLEYPDTTKHYADVLAELKLETLDLITCAKTETVGMEFIESLFAPAVKIAEERDVPLYCGEYGVISLASKESTVEWYKTINAVFKKYGISRAAWCYKKLDFGLSDNRLIDCIKEYL